MTIVPITVVSLPVEPAFLLRPPSLALTQHGTDLIFHQLRYLGHARLSADFILVSAR
jgi:hypothetical protein